MTLREFLEKYIHEEHICLSADPNSSGLRPLRGTQDNPIKWPRTGFREFPSLCTHLPIRLRHALPRSRSRSLFPLVNLIFSSLLSHSEVFKMELQNIGVHFVEEEEEEPLFEEWEFIYLEFMNLIISGFRYSAWNKIFSFFTRSKNDPAKIKRRS
jgi:hypothetical protein